MPKTTKATRKTSAASNKKLGLKNRFSLRSKKVQFFVVIGIVAILGGGYFVRQSFAATAIASVRADSFRFRSGGTTLATDPKKNNAVVLKIPTGGGAFNNTSFTYTPDLNYRKCIIARGSGVVEARGGPNSHSYIAVNDPNSYKTYCGKASIARTWLTDCPNGVWGCRGGFQFDFQGRSGTVFISGASLERL